MMEVDGNANRAFNRRWRRGIAAIAAVFAAVGTCAQNPPVRLVPEAVIAKFEERNAAQQQALRSYVSQRRYSAANPRLHKSGYMVVELRYEAPETKSYRVLEKGGSGSVHKRVFEPLLDTEVAQAPQVLREAAEMSRRNYEFKFANFDEPLRAYVFELKPRTQNKYLFRGKIWIDAADFAVRRIEGEPAQRPSFWVRKTHFVREYGKFGDFWLPISHRTQVDLLLLGASTMDIDYFDYSWLPNGSATPPASAPANGNRPPQ